MTNEIIEKATKLAPVYGDYSREGNFFQLAGRWFVNFLKVFFYKLGFIICVEGLSKSGVAMFLWPALNGAIVHSLIHYLEVDKAKIVDHYPMALTLFIQALIVFWWMNKSTAKKFILDFIGPALKDLASAFKR